MNTPPDVIIIGAGITGLTAAHRLRSLGRSVLVLEASERAGGVIRSERVGDLLFEHGPFSVMVRSREFSDLIDELGLIPIRADASAGRNRYIQVGGKLHLVPSSPAKLLTTSLLSPVGKARLLRGLLSSPSYFGGVERTLHEIAQRRLGCEAAERLASPGCIGIFAAEADELGVEACMPTLAEADASAGSGLAIKKVMRRKDGFVPDRSMISFDGGLAALTDTLANELGSYLRLSTPVRDIRRLPGDRGYELGLPRESVTTRCVVMTCNASSTARFVEGVAPSGSDWLDEIEHADLGVVHLVYPRDCVRHALDGFGYLIPRGEPDTEPVLGVIWPGGVFDHHGRPDTAVLRVMVGGTRWPGAMHLDDITLVHRSVAAIREVVGLVGDPVLSHVVAWPKSVPVYDTAHAARVRAILGAVESTRGLFAAGSWVCGPTGGLGVNDRVRHATRIAEDVAAFLESAPATASICEGVA